MTVTQLSTYDALTTMDLPATFDATYWPLNVERFLDQTDKPLHRAILKNYLRHILLEVSGYWDQIIVPELTIEEPVYRVGDRGNVHVLVGKDPVEGFYREAVEDEKNVMGARAMNMCIEDFGVVTEAVWAEVAPGRILVDHSIDADPAAHYLMTHNIFQVFAYTDDAKLIGERIYDDAASYRYEKLDPAAVVTPSMAREQLAPLLARATLD